MVSSLANPSVIMCTCASINPGRMKHSSASMIFRSFFGISMVFSEPAAIIILFFIKTAAFFMGFPPLPFIRVPFLMRVYDIWRPSIA